MGYLVNTDISDLFFNTEIPEVCKQYNSKKCFVQYVHHEMLNHAEDFLGSLARLGVVVPTKEQLVDDFYRRV